MGGWRKVGGGDKEALDAKRAKSNAVITLAAHSQLGGNSLLIGLSAEKTGFSKKKKVFKEKLSPTWRVTWVPLPHTHNLNQLIEA